MLTAQITETSGQPHGFEGIIAPVDKDLEALTVFLDEQLQAFEPEVRDLVDYCLRYQGKRIRPVLVLFSGSPVTERDRQALIQAAAVVELVHLATLVHDDILDDATLRHSSDTVSARWGTSAAVLLGDAVFSHALKLAADFPTVEVCRAVSLATRRVCAGEIRQTFERGNAQIKLEDYFRMIELKTAELFKVSCFLGAHLSGSNHEQVAATSEFGRQLGTAYQIYDDLADILGDEKKIGKTLGTDLASGKFTLPTLLLAQNGSLKAEELINIGNNGDFDYGHFLNMLRGEGIVAEVQSIFAQHLKAAEDALNKVKSDFPSRDNLLKLSGFVKKQMTRYA